MLIEGLFHSGAGPATQKALNRAGGKSSYRQKRRQPRQKPSAANPPLSQQACRPAANIPKRRRESSVERADHPTRTTTNTRPPNFTCYQVTEATEHRTKTEATIASTQSSNTFVFRRHEDYKVITVNNKLMQNAESHVAHGGTHGPLRNLALIASSVRNPSPKPTSMVRA